MPPGPVPEMHCMKSWETGNNLITCAHSVGQGVLKTDQVYKRAVRPRPRNWRGRPPHVIHHFLGPVLTAVRIATPPLPQGGRPPGSGRWGLLPRLSGGEAVPWWHGAEGPLCPICRMAIHAEKREEARCVTWWTNKSVSPLFFSPHAPHQLAPWAGCEVVRRSGVG